LRERIVSDRKLKRPGLLFYPELAENENKRLAEAIVQQWGNDFQ